MADAPILPGSNYSDVRTAIDVTLTPNDLSDPIIGADVYAGAAIDDVLERVPLAASFIDGELKRVQRAAILFCAARLIPAVIQITSITTTVRDMSISRPAWNAEKRAEQLRRDATQELKQVTGYSVVVESPEYSIVDATRTDAWT